jgi:hypothetical protein
MQLSGYNFTSDIYEESASMQFESTIPNTADFFLVFQFSVITLNQ